MHTTDQAAAAMFRDVGPAPTSTPGLHGRVLELVSPGLHRVVEDGQVRGYIEEAEAVFVSLAGPDYARAVEIGQSLSLERAVLVFSLRS